MTNTIRDILECPKCRKQFTMPRHRLPTKADKVSVICPSCDWDGDFNYLTGPDVE